MRRAYDEWLAVVYDNYGEDRKVVTRISTRATIDADTKSGSR